MLSGFVKEFGDTVIKESGHDEDVVFDVQTIYRYGDINTISDFEAVKEIVWVMDKYNDKLRMKKMKEEFSR